MNTHPACTPLAFYINPVLAAYINLAQCNESSIKGIFDCSRNYPELDKAWRDGSFAAAMRGENPKLRKQLEDEYNIFNLDSNFDNIDIIPDFEGTVSFVDEKLQETDEYLYATDANLYFVDARRSTPFKAAYRDMNEFLEEVRDILERLGVFDVLPEDFELKRYICTVEGTSFS